MRFVLISLLLTFAALNCVSAEVTNVFSRVREDGKIEIAYALKADDPKNTLPVFSVKFRGQLYGKKPFTLKSIDGAGKTGIILGAGVHVTVWNAAKDRKKGDLSNIDISVQVEDVSDEAAYLCLDLKKYKMRYQNEPPNIQKNKCRTKELWLRRIEPATFKMKNNFTVVISKAFYIGIFETTQKQFKTITGYNHSRYIGAARPAEKVSYDMLRGFDKGSLWPKGYEVDETCTYVVKKGEERITLEGPTFFYALRSKTGNDLIFDLPTETQWEYAGRAGTTTDLNSGKDVTSQHNCPNMDEVGRYVDNGGEIKIGKDYAAHTVVGSYLPNAWGIYDIHGNVCEWCLDWYEKYDNYIIDPRGAESGEFRILRGGAWNQDAQMCSLNHVTHLSTSNFDPDNYGFRIALIRNECSRDFEYVLSPETENTLPVFKVKFFAVSRDGQKIPLEELGELENDGASGIVVGGGSHRVTLLYDENCQDFIDELELLVEAEEITDEADYLIIDLPSCKMRTSKVAPDLNDDKCRTNELWLKRIETNSFCMGSPSGELGKSDDEASHMVELTEAYYVGVFEMTQKQFELITGYNPSQHLGETRPVDTVSYNAIRGKKKGDQWPLNRDVDEGSFLGLIRKKAGNTFDIPTEAQWENACRGGMNTALNSGKNLTDTGACTNLSELARYSGNGGTDKDDEGNFIAHAIVGSYLPNSWGIYDAHGNIAEWCLDWHAQYDGDQTDPLGPYSGDSRILRGGSWSEPARNCRCAARKRTRPDSVNSRHGFRIVIVK